MNKILSWLKHFFIPHEGNNHQPHSLRKKSLLSLSLIAIVVELIAVISFFPVIDKQLEYFATVLPSVLVDATNETRAQFALNQLTPNPVLTQAAQIKANDMAERGYFSHNTPEGLEPWAFLKFVGYEFQAAGENLAVNFNDSYDAHNAWLNSPGHRANILQNQFTEIGIATARGQYKGRSTVFVVQFFGRPQITQLANVPLNQVSIIPSQIPDSDVLGESILADNSMIPNESITSNEIVVQAHIDNTAISNEEEVESFITTENDKPVVRTEKIDVEPQSSISQRILSSPRTFASHIFIVLGSFIFLALILKIFFHIKKQYMMLIIQGILFLAFLAVLYLFNKELAGLFGVIG